MLDFLNSETGQAVLKLLIGIVVLIGSIKFSGLKALVDAKIAAIDNDYARSAAMYVRNVIEQQFAGAAGADKLKAALEHPLAKQIGLAADDIADACAVANTARDAAREQAAAQATALQAAVDAAVQRAAAAMAERLAAANRLGARYGDEGVIASSVATGSVAKDGDPL